MAEGLSVAMYGMGTVFVFLTLLVGVTMLMSTVILRFSAPEPAPATLTPSPKSVDAARQAAAVAAVHRIHA